VVAALPDRYRIPFVLHHLQGATVAEVAQRLGCPQGTVAGRLARAKEKLRNRLARKGVTASSAALAAVLSEGAAAARVPTPLLVATARVATAGLKGVTAGAAATTVVALTQGGGRVMLGMPVKVGAALLLMLGIAGGGSMLWGQRSSPTISKAAE